MRAGLVLALVVILGVSLAATSGARIGAVATNASLGTGAGVDARSVLASLQSSAADDLFSAPLDEAEIRKLARQAYVWGWPMVYVQNCRKALELVPAPARSGGMPVAPPNQLCMLTDYISPKQTVVPCPNRDVVYGFGILDLAREPVVVQVPDFGDRFWIYQLGDHRTEGFADIGKMYGTQPGLYLIVGPNWNGEKPAGIREVLRCPTQVGYILPRVFLEDTAADREAVLPVLNQIMAYPLSRYEGAPKTTDWKRTRWLPQLAPRGGKQSRWVKPETFFDSLATVLRDLPPLPGEEALYARLRELFARAEADASVKALLTEIARGAEDELVSPLFEFASFGNRLAHHWTTIDNGAAFGNDYLTRTAVARSNVFVNRNHETKYFYQDFDANGLHLDGSKSYEITFAPGELPPTDGFWSLTLYDENHALYQNDLERYSFGTKSSRLRKNEDGSLTIVVQSWPPAAGEQANWLPSPAGKFSLYLRAYGPKQELLSGAWLPPPVLARNERIDFGD
ncbi:MAG: hypothetical protein C0483_20200 [Pirellula sp.]|nr:hypothetical protein [Pirellula sp.]